jgi:hypothetical protein
LKKTPTTFSGNMSTYKPNNELESIIGADTGSKMLHPQKELLYSTYGEPEKLGDRAIVINGQEIGDLFTTNPVKSIDDKKFFFPSPKFNDEQLTTKDDDREL